VLKKKTLILALLGFCLVSTLFIGITISQTGQLQSTTPEKGYLSIPASAFEAGENNAGDWVGIHSLNNLLLV
jgi:hypothetical protein